MSDPDKKALNSDDGEDQDLAVLDDLEDEEEEGDEVETEALKKINEASGKNFKTIDQVSKSLKDADAKIAELGQEKPKDKEAKPKPPVASQKEDIPTYVEELLTLKYPEAELVLDELKEEASRTGKDLMTIFKGSTYFQNEAKARQTAKQDEEEAGNKVGTPSAIVVGKGTVNFEKIDLGNPQHIQWLKAKDGRMEAYNEWLKRNPSQIKGA